VQSIATYAGDAPAISVHQVIAEPSGTESEWKVSFLIGNEGTHVLTFAGARLPHGQFRGAEQKFIPPVRLDAGEKFEFAAKVHCQEPAGLVTENAFIIFLVDWIDERWRIFVRLRVIVDASGAPRTNTESISIQKVGFSGIND
jgi:hypothetical protein